MSFETKFFQRFRFKPSQIEQLFSSAKRDLEIAGGSKIPDVTFKFSYDALIKIGLAVIAQKGYRAKSTAGHHLKIIETLSDILSLKEVEIFGNKMRQDRNLNLYDGRFIVGEKEATECLNFTKKVFKFSKSNKTPAKYRVYSKKELEGFIRSDRDQRQEPNSKK